MNDRTGKQVSPFCDITPISFHHHTLCTLQVSFNSASVNTMRTIIAHTGSNILFLNIYIRVSAPLLKLPLHYKLKRDERCGTDKKICNHHHTCTKYFSFLMTALFPCQIFKYLRYTVRGKGGEGFSKNLNTVVYYYI